MRKSFFISFFLSSSKWSLGLRLETRKYLGKKIKKKSERKNLVEEN